MIDTSDSNTETNSASASQGIKFSILVPIYNSELYLQECIESVLRQTEPGFELVLVDDGSTDSSASMCDEYASSDPRITVLHKPNQGLLLARRDAIKIAKGSHITFLDSDDTVLPTFLADAKEIIETEDPDIIAFDFYSEEDEKAQFLAKPVEGFYPAGKFQEIRELTCTGRFHNVWSRIFKRSDIDSGADYSAYAGMTYTEDWFLNLAFINNASSFYYSSSKQYRYRENSGSITHTYNPKYMDYMFFTLDRLLSFSKQWGGRCEAFAKRAFINYCAAFLSRIQTSCATQTEILAERRRLSRKIYSDYQQLLQPAGFVERYYAIPLKCLKADRQHFVDVWLKLHSVLKALLA